MRVPLSWLSDLVDPLPPVDELAELLTVGGLEVEAIERPSGGVRGVVVATVEAVEKIEGSDKLSLVQAFDGSETLQVVCGASNFAAGDRVAWAKPGALLPTGDPDRPFELGRKTLFGVTSHGMLASPRELGVGDEHKGIWVLEPDAPLGADVAEWLDLDDAVLDIDVTPDRGYALSMIGVARDVAALTGAALTLPTATPADAAGAHDVVPVTIDAPDRCRRFDARTIRGVRSGPSPAWLQRRLSAAGMRPVSNIVDATNYAMLETGNPIHAYDLALLGGPRIEVRTARPGERLTTLDGVDRALDPDDLLICDADGPVGLAGVMGGETTEIGDATIDVLLEVASFTPTTVLRSARRHGLRTEGAIRWEKTVPPETAPLAATRCAELIVAIAGGRVTGGADTYPSPPTRPVIRLRPARARDHLGLALDAEAQAALLARIDCEVVPATGEDLDVAPPVYRPDLLQEADLYEEIVRLHGYDRVPEHVPATGQVGRRTPEHEARRTVRRTLAGAGWTEVMPFPFVADRDLELLGYAADDPRRRTVALVNPLSQEEAVLRTTLLPGLLRILRRNVNRQVADVAVFELGSVYLPPSPDLPGADGGPEGVALPAEVDHLGLVAAGAFEAPRHDRDARPVDLYDLLGAADLVRRTTGRPALDARPTDEAPFHPGRAARLSLDGTDVGAVGELHPRVIAAFDLPARTLAGELLVAPLVAGGVMHGTARVPSALPGLRFDVAVVVDVGVAAADVEAAVRAGASAGLVECRLFDVFTGPQLGEGKRSLAYTLRVDDPDRQLTDADEAATIEAIERAVADRVGGALRR